MLSPSADALRAGLAMRAPAPMLALLLALASTAPARSAPLLAAPYHSYDVGGFPRAVAVADLDADGSPDLIVANWRSNSFSVLRGNGDGTFADALHHAVNGAPTALAVADLNEDGRLDLAIATEGVAGTLSVLPGNGDGTFGIRSDLIVGAGPQSVAIADLNGDQHADLVAAGAAAVSVLLGNGDGTFRARRDAEGVMGARSVAIADLNGDRLLDLAVALTESVDGDEVSELVILIGGGDGSFARGAEYMTGGEFSPWGIPSWSVAVGDLNGDRVADLAAANYEEGGHHNSVTVLLGNGDATFQAQPELRHAAGYHSIVIADLDVDERMDLVTANSHDDFDFYRPRITVRLGNGDGSFAPMIEVRAGDRPWAAAVGDLDRDGRLDLAVTNAGFHGGQVSILLGNGDGTFGTSVRIAGPRWPRAMTAADLDADGHADLVCTLAPSSGVSVLHGMGDGTFGTQVDQGTDIESVAVEVADLNRDGRLDLATANYLSSTVSILLGTGARGFAPKSDFMVGNGPRCLAIADLNGDREPDLAVGHTAGPGTISILLGRGDGTFGERAEVGPGRTARSIAIADLDSDGLPDLAVAHITYLASADSNGVSVLLGNGDGTFRRGPTLFTGGEPKSVFIRDVDKDGRQDVLVVHNHYGIGVVSVLPGNGDGSFRARAYVDLGGGGVEATSVEDIDGDGRLDIATGGGDEWVGTVTMLFGNGDGTFGARRVFGCAAEPGSIALADFDGDARVDLAVFDRDASPILLLFGNGPIGGRVTFTGSDADPERIELRWSGREAATLTASVYRREAKSNWQLVGHPVPDGADGLRFEDRAVVSGGRYRYRLGYRDRLREVFTPETELLVPIPGGIALESLRPNPTADAIQVAFTLVDTSPATLELLDVSGRRVLDREVSSLGPGRHVLRLDREPRLPPGIYLVRLRQRERSWVLRAAVIR